MLVGPSIQLVAIGVNDTAHQGILNLTGPKILVLGAASSVGGVFPEPIKVTFHGIEIDITVPPTDADLAIGEMATSESTPDEILLEIQSSPSVFAVATHPNTARLTVNELLLTITVPGDD